MDYRKKFVVEPGAKARLARIDPSYTGNRHARSADTAAHNRRRRGACVDRVHRLHPFNLAMNAGPKATTFGLPPELFPTGIRASAGGLAAPAAKVGATLGIFVLPLVKARGGVAEVLMMMAIVSGPGALATAVLAHEVGEIPEGRSIDEAGVL